MARPRKADGDKLVPAKTHLMPARFDAYDRIARARGVPLAEVLREVLDAPFRERKTITTITPA